jgi:hypothetical protein
MLFGSWKSLVPEQTLPDPKADYKLARRAGQYKVSAKAIYQPDGTYLPFAAITDLRRDKSSVHVTGCCAGGVFVERIVATTAGGKFPFLFDSVKSAQRVLTLMQTGAGLEG